jgi:P22 coat protein - gene protein 5
MSNTLTAIVPKILAKGLMTLRETCVMPQLVNGDYSAEAKKFGATIDVPIPTGQTVTDVTPSNTPPAPASKVIETVQILLNKWKKTEFHLTDKEQREIDLKQSFFPMQVDEAARSLANQVNSDILAEYKGIYGYAGTAGTTPFATTVAGAIDIRKVLGRQLVPKATRRFVINADAEANALGLAAFQDVDKAGSDSVKKEGEIGRKFGFDWYMEDATPTHTAGTITTGLIAKAATAVAAGIKSFLATTAASTGAAALLVGDVIAIAGHTTTYVLTANATQAVAATDVTLAIEPALERPLVGSEAITVKASHVVNLGFHRDAFAFANRGVDGNLFTGGSVIQQMTDPLTGITIALEISRQHHQTVWEFSMLYGCKLVRPALAARLAG